MRTLTLPNNNMILTKDAMRKIIGGRQEFACNYVGTDGLSHEIDITADNINQAQAIGDSYAYSNQYTMMFPSGIDCPGAE